MSDIDPLEESAKARIGATFGEKYTLEALLGIGGMAAVYRARHRNGNRVALKVLHPLYATEKDVCGRFLREGYLANQVEHDGIVRVLDDDTERGLPFIVMELLEGATLDALWEKAGRKLPVHEVCSYAWQILDVLQAAHEKGIVHRDIKPENLFVSSRGLVKVLDFGIARVASASVSRTKTGRTLGTPAYMAPEQALGKNREVDGQSDIWALGATMFAALSGQYVQDAETPEQMMILTATTPARSVATVVPDLPQSLVSVIDKALAFAKTDRWTTAQAMQVGLQKAFESAYGVPLGLPAGSLERSSRSSIHTLADHPAVKVDDAAYRDTLPSERDLEATAADRPSAAALITAPLPNSEFGETVADRRSAAALLAEAAPHAPSAASKKGATTTMGISTDRPPMVRSPRRSLAVMGFAGLALVVGVIGFALRPGPTAAPDPASQAGAPRAVDSAKTSPALAVASVVASASANSAPAIPQAASTYVPPAASSSVPSSPRPRASAPAKPRGGPVAAPRPAHCDPGDEFCK